MRFNSKFVLIALILLGVILTLNSLYIKEKEEESYIELDEDVLRNMERLNKRLGTYDYKSIDKEYIERKIEKRKEKEEYFQEKLKRERNYRKEMGITREYGTPF